MIGDPSKYLLGANCGKGDSVWSYDCTSSEFIDCLTSLPKSIKARFHRDVKMRPPIVYAVNVDKSDDTITEPNYEIYFVDGGPIVEVTAQLPQTPGVPCDDLDWLGDGIEFLEIESADYGFIHQHSYPKTNEELATMTVKLIEANYNTSKFLDGCFGDGGTGSVKLVRDQSQPQDSNKKVKFYAPNGGMYLKYSIWMIADDVDPIPPICNGMRMRVVRKGNKLTANMVSCTTKPYPK